MVVNSAQAVADRYAEFSWQQARGESEAHEELTARISRDPEFCDFLGASLPPGNKQQPNLLLAAVRYLDGPHADQGPRGDFAYRTWREWTIRHWDDVRDVMMRRLTQTNEPARCATLLPLLARLPQPLALLEVGASAGLCLHPDRYRYRYDGGPEFGAADSPVVFPCRTSPGTPVPAGLPRIVWRAGIDLNPLDVTDPDDVRWLQALVWPGSTPDAAERQGRQLGAIEAVRQAPPAPLVRGDLLDELPALAAQAPRDATLVVFHTAVLTYLPLERREEFARVVRSVLADRAGHWVSNEHHSVLPWLPGPRPADAHRLTLAVDGHPVALTSQHGQSVQWLEEAPQAG
ncbi:DUF2332 domain-containing protein [Streptomyces purpurogeneiscleroticus]|uniref:DUF2332 domain-containing protein n=1 Tax=Streptomyces purpurogeneiscleroticus TaxID=68259 RepID=UPI001CC07421|nr:DUF2332 domain-containing protein [Streptomyces purpurogeneiscleroticus]MBZ4014671.1 hypothetical protein [Streptomyces purpurogeneiscleroticus]